MATPSLFPVFMKASDGNGQTIFLEGLEVVLVAEPDIIVEDDITITLEPASVGIVLDQEIEIEVE